MKAEYNPADDLQLVALMISKLLKADHGIDTPPAPADYRLVDERQHANQSQELQVGITIDRAVTVDVDHIWWGEEATDLTTLTDVATQMPDAISKIHGQRNTIIEMLADVKAAARKEVARGRRQGIPYRFLSVTPVPSADDGEVCMVVMVETLGENLRPRCLVPAIDGATTTSEWKEALWARFYTGAPRRQRSSVERYSIVKRA